MHILLTGNTAFKLANFRAGLMRDLLADGHQLSALVPKDSYFDALEKMGVRVIDLEMDRRGTSVFRELRLLIRFWQAFRSMKPDLVLGYTIKNNIYGALAARVLGIPFIPNVTGLGTAFESSGLLNRTVIQLYRTAFKRVPKVFFQNTHDRDLFDNALIIRKDKTALLPGSGVDLDEFGLSPLPNGDDQPVFLLVARMLKDKGVFEFVEAAKIVRSRFAKAKFRLLGPFDPGSRVAIPEDQLHDWAEAGIVEYLGAVENVRPHLRDADCMVLPSYYREGTPRALIEGAAMGRPIITTDMPGCRDVVEDGKTGFICKIKDAHDLADKMMEMVNIGKAGRSQMGAQGRLKAQKEFDEKIVVTAYRQAISDIFETSNVPRRSPK